MTPKKCKSCESPRLMYLRIDSDWGYGVGDYGIVNDDKYYTKEERSFDSTDRPSIHLYHCLQCEHLNEDTLE